jgi:hypothetical protein
MDKLVAHWFTFLDLFKLVFFAKIFSPGNNQFSYYSGCKYVCYSLSCIKSGLRLHDDWASWFVIINSLTKPKVLFMLGFFYYKTNICSNLWSLVLEFIMWEYMQKSFPVPSRIYFTYDVFADDCRLITPNWTSKTSIQSLTEMPIPLHLLSCRGCLVSSVHELPVPQQLNWDSWWSNFNRQPYSFPFSFCDYTLFFLFFLPWYIRCESRP